MRRSGITELHRIQVMTSFLTLTILGLDGHRCISIDFFRRIYAGLLAQDFYSDRITRRGFALVSGFSDIYIRKPPPCVIVSSMPKRWCDLAP